ncbi:MAG: hypothetical protein Kow00122_04320 [Thermoleophilia bacterium]
MDEKHETSFDLLVNIQSYTDDELKQLAERLQAEEHEISKTRRLIHAKLDILRAEMVRRLRSKHTSGESLFSEGDVEKLSSILSSRGLPPDEA